MTWIFDIIKGVFIGIANIIPGVSGGTIALSMGIYDKLIAAVSNFLKNPKKSILTLLPILLGCATGIVCFSYMIEYLLSEHTFVTCMAFLGLILGGVPVLLAKLKKSSDSHIGISGLLAFLVLFAAAVLLPFFKTSSEGLQTLTPSVSMAGIMFVIGVIASATMVIPGVSGSLVLMILGYYYGILNTITGFLDALKALDIATLTDGFILLFPFGIGVLLGIFLIAKLITFLFKRFGTQTYCAILGLILSSPVAIFFNTGLYKQLSSLNLPIILAGILLAVVGAAVTYILGEK